MPKRLFSLILALTFIFTISTTVFAAKRFSQEKFDSLPTHQAKFDYVEGIYKWYFENTDYGNSSVSRPSDVEEDFTALSNASAWLRANLPDTTTKLETTTSDRIAAIKKTYGIEFVIGSNEDGKYHKDAKVGSHLIAIENGLSCMGASLTKQLDKDFQATEIAQDEIRNFGNKYPWRSRLHIKLVPTQDIRYTDGSLERPYAQYSAGEVYLKGNNTNPVHIRDVVHEFGHALHYTLYDGKTNRVSEIFYDTKYGNYGKGKGFTGVYNASKYPDRFVSSYAQTDWAEDYAETFAVAVINGGDSPLKYGSDTVIYKKVKTIYDDLVKYVGTGSTATKRVGTYIGIKAEK